MKCSNSSLLTEHSTQACLPIHTVTDLQSFMKSRRCSFCLLRCTQKAIKTAFCFVAVSQLLLIVNCLVFFAGCVCSIISTWSAYYLARMSSGEVLWWAHLSVSLCVCLSVCLRWSALLQGDEIPRGRGSFWWFSSPLTMHCNMFAAEGIIQSPITSCSRRDHSVPATFTANEIGRKGVMEVHSAGNVWSTIALFLVRKLTLRFLCWDHWK